MTQTLLVFSKDRKAYERFVRDLGMRVSNIQYVYANDIKDVQGWGKDGIYYTVLDTTKRIEALDLAREKYQYVPIENLKEKLKERKQTKAVPTQ